MGGATKAEGGGSWDCDAKEVVAEQWGERDLGRGRGSRKVNVYRQSQNGGLAHAKV